MCYSRSAFTEENLEAYERIMRFELLRSRYAGLSTVSSVRPSRCMKPRSKVTR